MLRLSVPVSTRMMYGTVLPLSVVVVATSDGGWSGSYGLYSPGFVPLGWYRYEIFVGALHWASCGGPSPFSAVVQIHGWTCGPANTGPPFGWLVIVRRAPRPSGSRASSTFLPTRKPSTRPTSRPALSGEKSAVTSRPRRVMRTAFEKLSVGRETRTSTSPPETRSARLDNVSIRTCPLDASATGTALSAAVISIVAAATRRPGWTIRAAPGASRTATRVAAGWPSGRS